VVLTIDQEADDESLKTHTHKNKNKHSSHSTKKKKSQGGPQHASRPQWHDRVSTRADEAVSVHVARNSELDKNKEEEDNHVVRSSLQKHCTCRRDKKKNKKKTKRTRRTETIIITIAELKLLVAAQSERTHCIKTTTIKACHRTTAQ
jgi:hypothetical protein